MSQNHNYSNDNESDRKAAGHDRPTLHGEIIDSEECSQSGGQYGRRQGFAYGRTFTMAPIDNGGCLSSFITVMLFLICLGQYGLLAAIGFFVFHLIGSILGSVHSARQLIRGLPYSVWSWRVGNWIISFLVTVWLAGGLS